MRDIELTLDSLIQIKQRLNGIEWPAERPLTRLAHVLSRHRARFADLHGGRAATTVDIREYHYAR